MRERDKEGEGVRETEEEGECDQIHLIGAEYDVKSNDGHGHVAHGCASVAFSYTYKRAQCLCKRDVHLYKRALHQMMATGILLIGCLYCLLLYVQNSPMSLQKRRISLQTSPTSNEYEVFQKMCASDHEREREGEQETARVRANEERETKELFQKCV